MTHQVYRNCPLRVVTPKGGPYGINFTIPDQPRGLSVECAKYRIAAWINKREGTPKITGAQVSLWVQDFDDPSKSNRIVVPPGDWATSFFSRVMEGSKVWISVEEASTDGQAALKRSALSIAR